MQPATLCLAGLIGLAAAAATPVRADRLRNAPPSAGHYFVDFRARPGGVFGHTYVVYGGMDGRGRVVQPRYVGLYPSGAFSQTALLALLAVPGSISTEPADRHRRPDIVYRRRLSAAAYARLAGTVHRERKTPQAWDLIFYNCNSFAAEVANAIGLRTPPTFEFPNDFVRDLYVMNRSNRVVRAHRNAAARKRRRSSAFGSRDALFRFEASAGTGRVRR